MAGNWLSQSLIATFLLVPVWLAIGFLDRNHQVRPEVFLIWYFLGVAITSALFGGVPLDAITPSWKIVGVILFIGCVFGGIANIFIFRAVINAPNPGLPLALVNVASVGVFFAAALLARWAPNYFNEAKIDGWALLGLTFTVIGVALIAIRR